MKGQSPTLLANQSYFDTYDDRSSTYLHYSDTSGMPWALDLPNPFKYMKEKTKDLKPNFFKIIAFVFE